MNLGLVLKSLRESEQISETTWASGTLRRAEKIGLAWRVFMFHVLGQAFYLNIGENVNGPMQNLCIHNNPAHPITISDSVAQTFERIQNEHVLNAQMTAAYLN